MDELNEMVQESAIGWDTYGLAAKNALDDLAKAQKIGESKGPDALQFGSAAAFSAIHQFERGDEDKSAEALLKRAEQQRQRMIDIGQRTVDELADLQVVSIG
jgi:hypothetical protein